MGLDTTHDCYHGSYGGFHRWRMALADATGYPRCIEDEDALAIWEHYQGPEMTGHWRELPEDPLLIVMVHADTTGIIMADHCEPLAKRLEEVMPLLGDDEHLLTTVRFINGLRRAAAAGEDVEFH